MLTLNSSVLACNYAISGAAAADIKKKLNGVPCVVGSSAGYKLPCIKAQKEAADEPKQSEGRRNALFYLGAIPFAAAAFNPSANAGIIDEKSNANKLTEMASISTVIGDQSTVKVAAISGSLSKASNNKGLIRAAIKIAKESISGLEIEYVDISPLPIYNTDLERGGDYPPEVKAIRQKLLAADSILFATPEYNYSVTGALKNAIDWGSRPPNVFEDKAAAIVTTGADFGGGRAQYQLRQMGVLLNIHFLNKPEFFLNAYAPPPKFDPEGNLIDSNEMDKLKTILKSLYEWSLRLRKGKT